MSDAIIKNWFLVNLDHEGNIVAQVLWGIVIEDRKGRWQSDNYVCTSNVIERLGDNIFRTRNSVYECRGDGEEVTLEAKAILELRDGFSPEEYLTMKNLQERGLQSQ